jgi:hypothetical protein
MKKLLFTLLTVFALLFFAVQAWAWHDKTHLMIAKAAGRTSWYNAAGADLAKIKAGNIEKYNHWFNNNAEAEVTVRMVMNQVGRYNQRNKSMDSEGHVYGAIIASLRAYDKTVQSGKYAEYHLDYCAHYIGDLSQPLHNIPYDDYNEIWHSAADGVVENTIWDEVDRIAAQMYEIRLSAENFEADLAREIARIANLSRRLGHRLRKANRTMTKEEACKQLGHSASLLKAVLVHYQPGR